MLDLSLSGIFTALGVSWSIYLTYQVMKYFSSTEIDDRLKGIRDKEKEDDTIICIGHHDSGTRSLIKTLAADNNDHISGDTYENISKRLTDIREKYNEDKDISIYLHTPGGSLFYSQLIAHLLHNWKGKKTAHVIGYSASGGTLIALTCDQIYMNEDSVLGPIDPQDPTGIDYSKKTYSLAHCEEIFAELEKNNIDRKNEGQNEDEDENKNDVGDMEKLNILLIKKETEKTMGAFRKFLERILSTRYPQKYSEIINFFLSDRSHGQPIYSEECENIGLNVIREEKQKLD